MAYEPQKDELTVADPANPEFSDALARLTEQCSPSLRGYVAVSIRGPEGDVDEVVQRVWLDVLERLVDPDASRKYDPHKAPFYAWIKNVIAQFIVLRWKGRWRDQKEVPDSDRVEQQPGRDGTLAAEHAEALQLRLQSYRELFQLIHRCGGYPHQQVAFSLSQHVYGRESETGTWGDSEEVDKNHRQDPLGTLVDLCWETYRRRAHLPDDELELLEQHVEPVRQRCRLKVAALFANDRASREYYTKNLDQDGAVADVPFGEYYRHHRKGHTTAIPDWCDKVKKRVQRALEKGPDACSRCSLRQLPPCDDDERRTPPKVVIAD